MIQPGKYSIIILSLLTIFLTSCKKEAAADGDIAFISVYNASPNATTIDFTIDNRRISPGVLTLGQKSTYYGVYEGTWATEVIPSSSPTTGLKRDLALSGGEYISLFVVGPKDALDYFVVNDDITIKDPNRAKIKFLNLSPDAGSVYLEVQILNTVTPFETLAYKASSPFQSFDGGIIYTLTLKQATTNTVVGTPITSQFSPGKLYTVWAKGSVASTTEAERVGIQISEMN
jgi:hypothetical protein